MQEIHSGDYSDVAGPTPMGGDVRVVVTQMDGATLMMVFHWNEVQMYRLTQAETKALTDALDGFVKGVEEIVPAARNGSLDNIELLGNGEVDLGVCYRAADEEHGEGVTLVVDRADEAYPGVNHVALTPNGAHRLYVALLEASVG